MNHKVYAPSDVVVDELDYDGCYLSYRREDNEPIHVPFPEEDETLNEWAMNLDDDQLDAGLQIYYDRWNFKSGGEADKCRFDSLVTERKRRKLSHATFAPGIFAKRMK